MTTAFDYSFRYHLTATGSNLLCSGKLICHLPLFLHKEFLLKQIEEANQTIAGLQGSIHTASDLDQYKSFLIL